MTKTMKFWVVLNKGRFWTARPNPSQAWDYLYLQYKDVFETRPDFIKRFEARGWRCVEATATWKRNSPQKERND